MGPSLIARSIQSLEELRSALARYASDGGAALRQIDQDIWRTQSWLADRERHWRSVVERAREDLRRAEAAFTTCRAQVYRDPETGAVYVPPCTAEEQAVYAAQRSLQQSERELARTQAWVRQVDEAVNRYQSQARRLSNTLNSDLPQSIGVLDRHITNLHAAAEASAGNISSIVGGVIGGIVGGAVAGATGLAAGAFATQNTTSQAPDPPLADLEQRVADLRTADQHQQATFWANQPQPASGATSPGSVTPSAGPGASPNMTPPGLTPEAPPHTESERGPEGPSGDPRRRL